MRNWLSSLKRRPEPVAAPEPLPEPELTPEPTPEPPPRPPEFDVVAGAFDVAFYLGHSPDVAAEGNDPLEHFMVFGWREGRNPHPNFSVRDYLLIHPELEGAGVNPFLHFLQTGGDLKTAAESPLGFRYDVIASLTPIEARLAVSRRPVPVDDPGVLAEALGQSRSGLARLHVTFSHDDYSANLGGVQIALQREAAAIAARDGDHLHLFPARAWQLVRTARDRGQLGVLWNGRRVGVFTPKAIAEVLKSAAAGPARDRSFAIHSLLGHAADETARILGAVGLKAGFFWLHDFASLCAGFHLLRDDVQDCAAPPPESAACSVCLYGPWRRRHLAEHERLFHRLKLTVVAPSQPTLDLWRARWDFPAAGLRVHPHARLQPRGAAPAAEAGRPFRLAYAGLPVSHKGWPVFRELAARFADDPRYAFVHLGARRAVGFEGDFVEVAATPERPHIMQDALEAAAPDAVLVWPLCRETFSFVAYEAAAAGCAVITNPDSGNVAAFAADRKIGRVLDGEAALAEAFANGAILKLSRAVRRPRLYDLGLSALTADLLADAVPA